MCLGDHRVGFVVLVGEGAGHPGEVCDPSDDVLLNAGMPVGQTLTPEGSTAFRGATIGFSNKSANQDACKVKGATTELVYAANPN